MLYYHRLDISEGIDPTKSNKSRKCMTCHNCFLIMGSDFKIMYVIVVMI